MSLRPASTVRASFPVTAWTQVVAAREGDELASKAALEELCKGYWPAIYTYLRALGCDREEALDETQEFMTHFIQGGGLHNVSPERGRLRSYLRQSLRNHLTTVRRDAARQKRGGGKKFVSMDDVEVFDVPSQPDAADEWFDRRWAWAVVRHAMDRLEERYHRRNRTAVFAALKEGLICPEMLKPYAEIGEALRMTENQVKLEVHRARRRFAEELRTEVAITLSPDSDTDEELRYLMSVLSFE
ncbi:RNA polymerase sigma-70 factor, ECF subfamily [Prosthecobacter fusiformis]|uniref:RNA polymerase sigma-70 factor, ECF subfamily n=1 Tax=Prosthecobacter fusiformis TaxID=48464 RepID=A0A4V3FI58_9BACT|nr:sigma-70 family RNA polymerase sigma factor [Prosthecobacter fusiformis]TDU81163.1 RNA polymerase sigma-70 factor, ECF subfamily [Prosthecobacter fusiformis]